MALLTTGCMSTWRASCLSRRSLPVPPPQYEPTPLQTLLLSHRSASLGRSSLAAAPLNPLTHHLAMAVTTSGGARERGGGEGHGGGSAASDGRLKVGVAARGAHGAAAPRRTLRTTRAAHGRAAAAAVVAGRRSTSGGGAARPNSDAAAGRWRYAALSELPLSLIPHRHD
jgi:hypothetical protein